MNNAYESDPRIKAMLAESENARLDKAQAKKNARVNAAKEAERLKKVAIDNKQAELDAIKNKDGDYFVYDHISKKATTKNLFDWAKEASELGAGELFINNVKNLHVKTSLVIPEDHTLTIKNSTIKIIDFIFGCIYGLFLFSILFYFIFNLTLKNYFNESTMHKIMIYNIDLYDSLRLYEDDSKQESETIQFEEQNEIY